MERKSIDDLLAEEFGPLPVLLGKLSPEQIADAWSEIIKRANQEGVETMNGHLD